MTMVNSGSKWLNLQAKQIKNDYIRALAVKGISLDITREIAISARNPFSGLLVLGRFVTLIRFDNCKFTFSLDIYLPCLAVI